jgi:hypothetical protein
VFAFQGKPVQARKSETAADQPAFSRNSKYTEIWYDFKFMPVCIDVSSNWPQQEMRESLPNGRG